MKQQDDFSKLEPTKYMFDWLADSPFDAIRSQIEEALQQQVSESQLTSLRVTSEPQWLTGMRPADNDPDHAIVVRAGVVFEFALNVLIPPDQTHELQGTFSWVGVHMDDPDQAAQRVWFDLDTTLETHGPKGELMARMYFE